MSAGSVNIWSGRLLLPLLAGKKVSKNLRHLRLGDLSLIAGCVTACTITAGCAIDAAIRTAVAAIGTGSVNERGCDCQPECDEVFHVAPSMRFRVGYSLRVWNFCRMGAYAEPHYPLSP